MSIPNFKHTPESFRMTIERIVSESGLPYLDAVLHYCEAENLEPEIIPSLLKDNAKIKALLQEEGENLNLLEKTARLPI